VVICLERGADLHMAQLMPLPLIVSCFSKIQIGFTFLVPAHPRSPGQRAAKRLCVCVHDWSAADAVRADMIAELLQTRQQHDMRELNTALNEFRLLHQQPSTRREWDLYDPDALKKDRHALLSTTLLSTNHNNQGPNLQNILRFIVTLS